VTHKVMNSLILCSFSFGLAGTDIMVTFEVLLLNFLCNLIDIYLMGDVPIKGVS
jgi:hypothetical protein